MDGDTKDAIQGAVFLVSFIAFAFWAISLNDGAGTLESEPQKCWLAHVGNSFYDRQVEWVWCEPGGLQRVQVGGSD